MTPHEIKQQPVTVPFEVLYNLLFDIGGLDREYVDVSDTIFKALLGVNHIQDLLHRESSIISHRLWRLEAWKASAERLYQERQRQDTQSRIWFLRKEAIAVMVKAMRDLSSIDYDSAETFATSLLRRKMKDKCKMLGVEGDKWKELFE